MSADDAGSSGRDLSAAAASQLQGALQEQARAQRVIDQEFTDFYRDATRKLVAFLASHGATVSDAADIAQTAMIKLYQRWEEIQHPKAWVYTVAARALVRKISEVREDPVEQVPEPTSLLPHPEAASEWECRQEALRVLEGLPIRQRQVLAWTFSGFTPSEIAHQIGMSPEAVRASLKKARRAAAGKARQCEEGQ